MLLFCQDNEKESVRPKRLVFQETSEQPKEISTEKTGVESGEKTAELREIAEPQYVYIVKPGDTLSKIAREFQKKQGCNKNLTYQEIFAYNTKNESFIQNVNTIYVGQQILIPKTQAAQQAAQQARGEIEKYKEEIKKETREKIDKDVNKFLEEREQIKREREIRDFKVAQESIQDGKKQEFRRYFTQAQEIIDQGKDEHLQIAPEIMEMFTQDKLEFLKTWNQLEGVEHVQRYFSTGLFQNSSTLHNTVEVKQLVTKGRNQLTYFKVAKALYNLSDFESKADAGTKAKIQTLKSENILKGTPDECIEDYKRLSAITKDKDTKQIFEYLETILSAALAFLRDIASLRMKETTPYQIKDIRQEAVKDKGGKGKVARLLDQAFPTETEGQMQYFSRFEKLFMSKEKEKRKVYYFDIENGISISVPEDQYTNLFSGEYGFAMLFTRDEKIRSIDEAGNEVFNYTNAVKRLNELMEKGMSYCAPLAYMEEHTLSREQFIKQYGSKNKDTSNALEQKRQELVNKHRIIREFRLATVAETPSELSLSPQQKEFIRMGLLVESMEKSATYMAEVEEKTRREKKEKEQANFFTEKGIQQLIASVEKELSPNLTDEQAALLKAELPKVKEQILAGVFGLIDIKKTPEGTKFSGGGGVLAPIPINLGKNDTITLVPALGVIGKEAAGGIGIGYTHSFDNVALTIGVFGNFIKGAPNIGAGASIGVKLGKFRLTFGAAGPVLGASVMFERDFNDELSEKINESYEKSGLREIEQAFKTNDFHRAEKLMQENPLFEGLREIFTTLKNTDPHANQKFIHELFEFTKHNVQFEEIERFKPILAGIGVMYIHGVSFPVPVLKIVIGRKHLIHRFTTEKIDTTKLSDQKTRIEWIESLNQGAIEAVLRGTLGRVGTDETGYSKLISSTESAITVPKNLSFLYRINKSLKASDIILQPNSEEEKGYLLEMEIKRADGNIEIHIDPESNINLIYGNARDGSHVYLGMDEAQNIYVTRQDFMYAHPIDPENNAVQKTIITISGSSLESRKDFEEKQGFINHKGYYKLDVRQGFFADETWAGGRREFDKTKEEKEKTSNNIMSIKEYRKREETPDSNEPIAKFEEVTEEKRTEVEQELTDLMKTISIPEQGKIPDDWNNVYNVTHAMIEEYNKDPDGLWKIYKKISTFGYDYTNGALEIIAKTQGVSYKQIAVSALIQKHYNGKVPLFSTSKAKQFEELSYSQQLYVTNQILRESFTRAKRFESKEEKRKELQRQLGVDSFNYKMLVEAFKRHGDNPSEAPQMADKVKQDILEAFNNNELPQELEPGHHMASAAGTQKIVGWRYSLDFGGTYAHRFLGIKKYRLDSNNEMEEKIARAVLRMTSPLPGEKGGNFDKKTSFTPEEIQTIAEFLNAPLTMKVAPFLTLKELDQPEKEFGTSLNKLFDARNKNDLEKTLNENEEVRNALKELMKITYSIRYLQNQGEKFYSISEKHNFYLYIADIATGIGAFERCDNPTMVTQEKIHLYQGNVDTKIAVSDETIEYGNYEEMLKLTTTLGAVMVKYEKEAPGKKPQITLPPPEPPIPPTPPKKPQDTPLPPSEPGL